MVDLKQYEYLPPNLPEPVDDGLANHLVGMSLPNLTLPMTTGEPIAFAKCQNLLAIFVYPMSGRPGVPLPEGWDDIPGARGCTPQACNFRNHADQFERHGCELFGLSTQDHEYQTEFASRLELPFSLISDHELKFGEALRFPHIDIGGRRLWKRLTIVANKGKIVKCFYPIFPSNSNAEQVLEYLSEHN